MNSKAIKRQLLAAIAMVLVAALALGSSTYAWFVGNNNVTAEGMKVQAQAESGILIKSVESTDSNKKFSTTASALMTDAAKLYPASTVDLTNWYHAVSDTYDLADKSQPAGDYTSRTNSADDIASYRCLRTFWIRSADATKAIDGMDLAITSVTVTEDGGNTENLNKSIRVGIKVTGEAGTGDTGMHVYAPLGTGSTLAPTYAASGTVKSVTSTQAPTSEGDRLTLTAHGNQIPANDTDLVVEVYIWYEGEDDQCKSSNLPLDDDKAIDNINVTVSFKAVPIVT